MVYERGLEDPSGAIVSVSCRGPLKVLSLIMTAIS